MHYAFLVAVLGGILIWFGWPDITPLLGAGIVCIIFYAPLVAFLTHDN